MNASRRIFLTAVLAGAIGAPAAAQVQLPPPSEAPVIDFPASGVALPSQDPAAARSPQVAVNADPRVELMSLLVSRTRLGKLQQDDAAIAYRNAATAAFKAYDSHPAIKLLEELQAQGFVGAKPYQFALALKLPDLTLVEPLPPELQPYSEKLTALLMAMQGYMAQSRFMDFYATQKSVYEAISRKMTSWLQVNDLAGRVEEFYGVRWDRYTVIPAPLLNRTGMGVSLTHADGTREVLAIVGALGATAQQEPDFYQPDRVLRWLESAIGQTVVPVLTAAYEQDVRDTEELFSPLAERLGAQGVSNWQEAVNAHVLRAIGARILQGQGKVREAQLELQRHEREGYWYVRKFFDLLAVYEGDRKTYPTLESYYPRMMATMGFWKDSGEHVRIEAAAKRFMGPIGAAMEERYLSKTVFVRPEPTDPEKKKLADDFVRNLVARYRERFGITLQVVTSMQAAAMDPAQTVFLIYGTPESNAYLKALLSYLPIKVSRGDLHLGARQYKGSDLRLVTAIPNPYNPTLPIRIITGTSEEVVLSELGMLDTQSDFVVYRAGKLYQQGDYLFDEKGAWRVP